MPTIFPDSVESGTRRAYVTPLRFLGSITRKYLKRGGYTIKRSFNRNSSAVCNVVGFGGQKKAGN